MTNYSRPRRELDVLTQGLQLATEQFYDGQVEDEDEDDEDDDALYDAPRSSATVGASASTAKSK